MTQYKERINLDELGEMILSTSEAIQGWVFEHDGGAEEVMAIAEGVLLQCWVAVYKVEADELLLPLIGQHLEKALTELRTNPQ